MENFNHLEEATRHLHLTDAERRAMRDSLVAHLNKRSRTIASPYQRFFAPLGAMVALGMLLVVVGLQNANPLTPPDEAPLPERTVEPASLKTHLMTEADASVDTGAATSTATSTPVQ